MLSHDLNNNLIAAVKEKLAPGANLANVLMKTLCIGREAIYRRLRGEVPFTFAETVTISREMDISLDSLAGNEDMGFSVVDVHYSQNQDDLSAYRSMLESQVDIYSKLGSDPQSHLHVACNVLPYLISLNSKYISKFNLFKWLYQRGTLHPTTSFGSFEMGPDLLDLHKRYVKAVRSINHGSCLIDSMIFEYLASDLRYFFNIGLLTSEDMDIIKEDILILIDELEGIAIKGRFESGKELQLYISSVNFDSTYGYVQGHDSNVAIMKICSINLITSTDVKLFEQMKVWIESLRKFSTLISLSGEMQRITFFNKQRAAISQL